MSFLRNITTGLRSFFRKEQVERELETRLIFSVPLCLLT
jgi:hypothetical protein